MSSKTTYLCLGSNLGDRAEQLQCGLRAFENVGINVLRQSNVYETEPMDVSGQPWFLNTVVEARTALDPMSLLRECKRIETACGRVPSCWHGPRHLDIDILLYGRERIETDALTIPHARMRERRFVLIPLVEIAPELTDPVTDERYADCLKRLDEGRKVFSSQIKES